MANLTIYEETRKVPKEAQKTITGGRLNGFTDINPMWRIKKLTELFGACGFGWYTEITNKWLEPSTTGEVSANVEIKLFVKMDGEWSMPIVGIGGSMFVANEKKGIFTSDEAYKMAYTDAISIACKALGFGADIYFAKDRTKYDTSNEPSAKTAKVATQADIEDAIFAVNICKIKSDLQTVWNEYKMIDDEGKLAKAIAEKRKELGL
jgi:hypothetical protein